MGYTPRTLKELLNANPIPVINRVEKDGMVAVGSIGESLNGTQ